MVEATFVYNAAMRDQMLPRKPLPHPELEEQGTSPLKNIMPGAEAEEKGVAPKTDQEQPPKPPAQNQPPAQPAAPQQ